MIAQDDAKKKMCHPIPRRRPSDTRNEVWKQGENEKTYFFQNTWR